MRLISIDELEGNEILAIPVMSANGSVLIHADTELKDEYISRLKEYNINLVYIREKNADCEEDINSEEESPKRRFNVDNTLEASKGIVETVLKKHIYKQNEDLKIIGEAAQRILDTVISEPEVINNVTEIRNISTDMYSHCINVCILSTIMALRLKMSEQQVKNVALGAILHDIGLKYIQVPYIGVNLSSLSANDALEYKKHTIYGYSSIQEEIWLTEVAKEIILMHHERIDGEGFPFRQKGSRLRAEVRLVALCDDFDSMISGIGSKKMKIYEAIEYVRVHSGKIYDPTIAAKFLETVAMYPVGANVITNEGEEGIVVRQNKDNTERPVIKMLKHSDGTEYEEYTEKDLMKLLTLFIVDTF